MIYAPHMLMVGSGGRNSGKTTFACTLIRQLRETHPVAAAKVTAIQDRDGACPRGGEGCGVCAAMEGRYCITEETAPGGKDTQRLRAAGARQVYWLRVLREHLEEGAAALLETLGGRPTLCESNSLRTVIEPDLFLLLRATDAPEVKASARAVADLADRVILWDGQDFDLDPTDVCLKDNRWMMWYPASAIILAGGMSARMREDKSLLPIAGRPMIQHLHEQLRPHFQYVAVSANDAQRLAFLGLPIVPDRVVGRGPLMGILSALEHSPHDRNFVVACDVPDVGVRLVRQLMREVRDCDAAVPTRTDGRTEPLFAVYRKSAIRPLEAALADGETSVRNALQRCKVRYVPLSSDNPLRNLNTPDDYRAFVAQFESRRQEQP